MKARLAEEVDIYESLVRIQLGFAQILEALENLQQHKTCRGPSMTDAVRSAREVRAGTLFEVLEILHARAERDWTKWGRRLEYEADR